jgi:AcrR family transcriptional regulator
MVNGHMSSSSSATSPDRRQRRSSETRERLFRAALNLFAQHGFADTTVEDITNAADLGKGTFFNYFPSKEHMLLAFAEMQLSKLGPSSKIFATRMNLSRNFFALLPCA